MYILIYQFKVIAKLFKKNCYKKFKVLGIALHSGPSDNFSHPITKLTRITSALSRRQ